MGLFSYNFSKPGKGVDPDAPQKNAFFKFWELTGRKFFKLVTLNLMYFVVISPMFIYAYGAFYSWISTFASVDGEAVVTPLLGIFMAIMEHIPSTLYLPLLLISAIAYGPFTAGLTYILRNYTREEHAWITDFFQKAKENFRQGLFFGILDILVVIIMYINWTYAWISTDSTAMGIIAIIIKYLSLILFIVYFFMRLYFYQIVVTVNLPIRSIVKNSWIFTVLGFGRNLIATLAIVATMFIGMFLNSIVELVVVLTFLFAFCGFIAVYCTYPVVEKYIIIPAKEKAAAEMPPEPEYVERGGELPPELGGPGAGALGLENLMQQQGQADEKTASHDQQPE